jgi:hypothetical protein
MRPPLQENQRLDQQRERIIAPPARRVKAPSVGLVVDTQYLSYHARDCGNRRIDYTRLIYDVTGGTDWVGVACVAKPLSKKSIEGFLGFVRAVGLAPQVWQSPVAFGVRKVNLDTLVVREATCLVLESQVRELCIVGPDCDYYVVAELCRQRGVKFTVAGFRHTIGGFMRAQADRVVELGREHLLPEAA